MRQLTVVAVSIAFVACSFPASNGANDGRVVDGTLPIDSNVVRDAPSLDAPSQFTVTHLGVVPPAQLNGVVTVSAGGHNIDTSSPGGMLNLVFVAQAGNGPQLAVAYFDELTIDGNLFVFGTRPLVIVANKITVNGTIDASAAAAAPGPGGSKPGSADAGNGGKGVSGGLGSTNDSGGGGGGFGSPGGAGGAATGVTAGMPGPADTFVNLPTLRGGAAGGAAQRCSNAVGGAGGGAVQLSARVSITIAGSGSIHTGGGGGSGGDNCVAGYDAGSGGGSGGAIYIEAPTGSIAGGLWANGGAGGAGRYNLNDANLDGSDGSAARTVTVGASSTPPGGEGGNGAAFTGTNLVNATGGNNGTNGGGGGGGVGRIVIRGMFVSTGNFSPLPFAP